MGTVRRQMPPSVEEVGEIAAALPGELGAMWRFSCWTGLRLSEAAAVHWEDVNLIGPRVWVRKGKGGKSGWAVLLPQALDAIELGRPGPRGGLVFRNSRFQAWNRKSVNKHFVGAMAALRMPFVYHDSRKFFATYLLNQGVADLDVAVALRHIDKFGRPNTKLVQQVYGYVDLDAALARVNARVAGRDA